MEKIKKKSSLSNILYMLKALWDGCPIYVFFTFFKEMGEGIFGAFFQVYMVEVIYRSIENKTPFSALVAFVGGMCIGHVVIHLISATHQFFSKQLIPEMYRHFYKRVIEKSISMDYTRFEEPDFYDKYTRALTECQSRSLDIIQHSAILAANVVAVICSIFIIADIDPALLVFVVPMVFVSCFFGKKCGELYYQLDFSNTRDGRTAAYAKRVFYEKKYAGELRLFQIGRYLLSSHEKAYETMQERSRIINRKVAKLEILQQLLFGLLSMILPYLYITYVLQGEPAKTASYIAMIPALSFLAYKTSDAVENIVDLAKEGAFVTNLREFLSYVQKNDQKEMKTAPELKDIEINRVSFTYKGAMQPTLHDVNMTIKKGEKVAIVGHNGAGKTTLVKLIMGLYSATSGEIKISDENIDQYEKTSLYNRFGTVFQDLQIFALPLSVNVLMYKPKNEEERQLAEESLKKAQFGDKLASLEHGIDTMVTKEFDEKGMGLSGGEAQKIAIARVFAHKPDIVILDEPSSALDPIAEHKMYQNMMTATDGETVIFISHRLSATCDADRIYLFENGTIIEQGNHKELMELNGEYAKMWRFQAQNYLAGEVTA